MSRGRQRASTKPRTIWSWTLSTSSAAWRRPPPTHKSHGRRPPTPFLGITSLISWNESRARASARDDVPRQKEDKSDHRRAIDRARSPSPSVRSSAHRPPVHGLHDHVLLVLQGRRNLHLRKPDLQPGPLQYGGRPPLRAPVHGRGDS